MFLGDYHKNFICNRCLNSYTNENALTNYTEKYGDDNICAIRTSSEPHLYWKKQFHKNLLYFKIYVDCEADSGKYNSSVGKNN